MNTKKAFLILLTAICCCTAIFAQEYKNPVISGFYPDPSICWVGDDYFIVNNRETKKNYYNTTTIPFICSQPDSYTL